MFEQISHLAKFWFLRYGPKLAVSHKQINQWSKLVLSVSVQQFSEVLLIFSAVVGKSNIKKLTETIFP